MWCGFPSWRQTAEYFGRCYRQLEPHYDKSEGQRLLNEGKFPELFELCRLTNQRRYNQELASQFTGRALTPVYGRFIRIVNGITPLQIVTTNIDETLERNLSSVATVQKSDLERCLDLVGTKSSFVAKLHGSVGSVESVIFSSRDYQKLVGETEYLRTLEALFARATVVFIGYSLRDKYVLDLFASNCGARHLFGDGPHFLVEADESPSSPPSLPESIKTIRYLPEPHSDHRSAMTVLDIIRVVGDSGGHLWFAREDESRRVNNGFVSAYFISDVIPPGTWTSSQSLELAGTSGLTPNAIVGQGFIDSELPDKVSHAMYDLTVGLLSFDRLYFPLSRASRLHDLLGSARFWDLVKAGIFRFIYFEQEPVVMFKSREAVDSGDIGCSCLPKVVDI